MITFTVWKSGHQHRGFLSEGHAEYAEEGADIVCAAVSALTLNAVNSIEAFTDDPFQAEQAEDGGYLKVTFPEPLSAKASLLMDSLVFGIQNIETEYGNDYITLLFREV